MTKDPLLTATELKQEAKALLSFLRLEERIAPFGRVKWVGSFAWDLMTWKDVDLQVLLHPGASSRALFNALFLAFSSLDETRQLNHIRFIGHFKPHMPRGHCLGLVCAFPGESVLWKADIWVLSPEAQAQSDAWEELIARRLTPEARSLILNMKQRMMEKGRVPQGGSYALYQLVLREEIVDAKALQEKLEQQGYRVAAAP